MALTRKIDFSPLERLLHLAGETSAPLVVATLLADLKTTETSLASAWNGPDFAALRTNSHITVALAGTIGDSDLQALAQRLNTAAQTQNLDDLIDMKEQVMAYLSDLIALLAQHKTTRGN